MDAHLYCSPALGFRLQGFAFTVPLPGRLSHLLLSEDSPPQKAFPGSSI